MDDHRHQSQRHRPATEASAALATASDSAYDVGVGAGVGASAGVVARRASYGLDEIHDDEEAPREIPQDSQAPYHAASQGTKFGFEMIIDDDETQREKAKIKARIQGSVEQIPSSEPLPDEVAARAHDYSATKAKRGLESVPSCDRPPLPDTHSALAYDDSLELQLAKNKASNSNQKDPAGADDDADADDMVLPQNESDRSGAQLLHGRNNINRDDTMSPNLRSSVQTNVPTTSSNTIMMTADIQPAMSPYVNESDEICIPEATAVDDQNIPAAEIIRPEKYSLTVAGRKIRLRYLILGMVLMLGAAIALAVTLTRRKTDSSELLPSIPEFSTSVPSVSSVPSSYPSFQPSSGPTAILQAKLVNTISEYSEGRIPSLSSSKHRMAMDWLVNDQSAWEEDKKDPLPGPELVERFVLALMYLETQGGEWSDKYDFMSIEHVCKWRGYHFVPDGTILRKGIMMCTGGNTGRVKKLTLSDNNLKGSLPSEIGLLQELNNFNVGFNDIKSDISDTLGSLTQLTHLKLNNNDLVGRIDSLAGLTNLQYVDLSSNDITGSLMDVSNLTELKSLKVSGNKLSGSVPISFSNKPSLESLHIHGNDLSGSIDFMCKYLPLDYQLDCRGDKPEIECNCCIYCTKVNAESCDPNNEKRIALDIYAGKESDGFEWELRDSIVGDLIAAGGGYDDKEELNVQLCLSIPGQYKISASAPSPPTNDGAKVSFSIGDYNSTVGPSSHHPGYDFFYVDANPTSSPTQSPTVSEFPTISLLPSSRPTTSASPTSSSRPSAPTNAPTSDLTFGSTPTIGSNKTLLPTPLITRPPPCHAKFRLDLTTDDFGIDTSWELIDKNSSTIVASESGLESNRTYAFMACLDKNTCYDFVIKDAWDDGICCQVGFGSYNVSVDGKSILRGGGKFGSSETVFICGSWGAGISEPNPSPTWLKPYTPILSYPPTYTQSTYPPTTTTPPTHPETPFPTKSFLCPDVNSVGCTAIDLSNPIDECTAIGTPCSNGNAGEFCCRDACPRNYCIGGRPTARDDEWYLKSDEYSNFIPVLDNDSPGAEGGMLEVRAIMTAAANGQCGISTDLTNVIYEPADGFTGIDSCVYKVCDYTVSLCDTAILTIEVDDQFLIESYIPCPDPDFLGCTDADPSNPTNECLTVGAKCGIGIGAAGICCRDACPRNVCTEERQDPLSATGGNNAPVARDDIAYMDADEGYAFISVLDNDTLTAEDGFLVVRSISTKATHGECTISLDLAEVVYRPDDGFTGTDSCVYSVCDVSSCDTAVLTITVKG